MRGAVWTTYFSKPGHSPSARSAAGSCPRQASVFGQPVVRDVVQEAPVKVESRSLELRLLRRVRGDGGTAGGRFT